MDKIVDVESDALAEEKSEPAPLPQDSDAQCEEESAQAQEKPKQPQRLAFKRAERRRLQRIVVKGIARRRKRKQPKPRLGPHDFMIEWTEQHPKIEPARSPHRAARRAMQRTTSHAMYKQIRTFQRQMPLLCPRCQQPYIGPSGWRCACKAERQVEFVAAE